MPVAPLLGGTIYAPVQAAASAEDAAGALIPPEPRWLGASAVAVIGGPDPWHRQTFHAPTI